jgi:HEAT repeat protein
MMGAIGTPRAVKSLIAIVRTEDRSVWKSKHTEAMVALGAIGASAQVALPLLLEFLDENREVDYSEKLEAVIAIGKIGAPAKTAIPALRRIMDAPANEWLEWQMSDSADEAIIRIERALNQ